MDSEERGGILGGTHRTFRWFLVPLCGGDRGELGDLRVLTEDAGAFPETQN